MTLLHEHTDTSKYTDTSPPSVTASVCAKSNTDANVHKWMAPRNIASRRSCAAFLPRASSG
jgi:hypothetical protein